MELRYIAAIKELKPMKQNISVTDNKVADTLSRPPHVTSMHIMIMI